MYINNQKEITIIYKKHLHFDYIHIYNGISVVHDKQRKGEQND